MKQRLLARLSDLKFALSIEKDEYERQRLQDEIAECMQAIARAQ